LGSSLNLLGISIAVATGCAATDPTPRRPLGAAEHYAEAREHEREAQMHDRAARAQERAETTMPACGDRVLAEQSTSGGSPISLAVPCWTTHSKRDSHLHRAATLRRDASRHRAIAASLIETARAACASLPASERDHSPSWHRDDILAIAPVRANGPVRGARIVFRRVPGLDADWLRRAYACHQAQAAAMGYEPTFMGYCPAAVDGARVDVADSADGIEVTIVSERWEVAAVIFGRALDLRHRQATD
jgi:hypothetical protein